MNPNTRTTPMLMRLSKAIATTTALAATVVLAGCASSLSGVGGTEGYACKAPIGAQCTSVSGVYANAAPMAHRAVYETLRQQQAQLGTSPVATRSAVTQASTKPGASTAPASTPSTSAAPTATPAALRSPARVVRLWIAPWEDADGDLHDASFVHVVVDTGRWLIERVRPAPRSRLDIAPPPVATSVAPSVAPAREATEPADLTPTEP
jgi:conjugal transfer pilus assembly protein TraV